VDKKPTGANESHGMDSPASLPRSSGEPADQADPRITHQAPSFKVAPRPNVDSSTGRALGGTKGGHTFERAGRRFSD
jgi:hypothetical protein